MRLMWLSHKHKTATKSPRPASLSSCTVSTPPFILLEFLCGFWDQCGTRVTSINTRSAPMALNPIPLKGVPSKLNSTSSVTTTRSPWLKRQTRWKKEEKENKQGEKKSFCSCGALWWSWTDLLPTSLATNPHRLSQVELHPWECALLPALSQQLEHWGKNRWGERKEIEKWGETKVWEVKKQRNKNRFSSLNTKTFCSRPAKRTYWTLFSRRSSFSFTIRAITAPKTWY